MMMMMRVRLTLMISLVIIMNIFCHTSSQGLEILRTLIPDPAPLRSIELLSEGRWTFRQTAESLSSPICDPFWLAPLWLT